MARHFGTLSGRHRHLNTVSTSNNTRSEVRKKFTSWGRFSMADKYYMLKRLIFLSDRIFAEHRGQIRGLIRPYTDRHRRINVGTFFLSSARVFHQLRGSQPKKSPSKKVPNNRQRIFLKCLELEGEVLFAELDRLNLPIRKKWLKEGCPKTHLDIYKKRSRGPWCHRIQRENQK